MKKSIITSAIAIAFSINVNAQTNTFPTTGAVGIGTIAPNSKAILDIVSTTKGILVPRMTQTQRNAIVTPPEGLLIYQNTNTKGFYYYTGTAWTAITPSKANTTLSNLTAPTAINQALMPNTDNLMDLGSLAFSWRDLYVDGVGYVNTLKISNYTGTASAGMIRFNGTNFQGYNGTAWKQLDNVASQSWSLTGNSGTNATANFIGTTDNTNLLFRVNNIQSGYLDGTTGNTSFGVNTPMLAGSFNTALGNSALITNSSGNNNCVTGAGAMYVNSSGSNNCAYGFEAMHNNTSGTGNCAIGYRALYANNTAGDGSANVAIGNATMFNNQGNFNIAIGEEALYSDIGDWWNVAIGYKAMYNTNSTIGNYADDNVAIGESALFTNTTGNHNMAIGSQTDVSAGNLVEATAIGAYAVVNSNDKIRLGDGYVTVVESNAGSWTTSDGRFKDNIKEEVKGLDFINQLRPVVYNFDVEKYERHVMQNFSDSTIEARLTGMRDGMQKATTIRQTGFIAQEVEEAAKKVGYDFNGVHHPENPTDNYSLSYEKFTVPLVKAVQELSKQNDELKNDNNQLRNELNEMKSCVESLCNNSTPSKTSNNELATTNYLLQNNPNPFNQSTTIRFSIPQNATSAFIKIYSLNGVELKSFDVKNQNQISVAANSLSAGVYAYVLIVDDNTVDTKQMIVTK